MESKASSLDEIIEELKTTNTSERAAGQDKEDAYTMQKLRSSVYVGGRMEEKSFI